MHYDKFRERSSIDDATPEEWNEAARKDREYRFIRSSDEREAVLQELESIREMHNNRTIDYKYNEGELIREFQEYVDSTYGHLGQKRVRRLSWRAMMTTKKANMEAWMKSTLTFLSHFQVTV